MDRISEKIEYLKVKNFRITSPHTNGDPAFSVRYLGIHETMNAGMVDRPRGTGDYLLMLFHTEALVRTHSGEELLPPSSLVIWEPKDGHFYGNARRRWDHTWIHCQGNRLAAILKSNRLPARRHIFLPDPAVFEKGLSDMAGELRGRYRPDGRILTFHFEILARSIARQCSGHQRQPIPDLLLELRGYLEQHLDERIRLASLARRFGYSITHLCTEFKKHFGVPVGHCLHQLRMNQAVLLLHDPNRRVREIGEMVGYPDPYTFSKMFRRHFGVSPRRFRVNNPDS